MFIDCYSIGEDVEHCQRCHNTLLPNGDDCCIVVTLLDGRMANICGPMARTLFAKGLLSAEELKRFRSCK
jgi:hypothetical protein